MYHGGNLTEATRRFGTPAGGWLDLSTGINPEPYPHTHIGSEALAQLPQPDASNHMIDAARRCYQVPDGTDVIAGPGTEFLIDLIARQLTQKRAAIIGPTYGGHAEAWERLGCDIGFVSRPRDIPLDATALTVVNPNNPDGSEWQPKELIAIAEDLAAREGWLIVDEAFCDVRPELSIIPYMGALPVVVLRSFGKFYGLAGLRLGFAIAPPAMVASLSAAMPPWSVSGPAIEVGARALADHEWATATRSAVADGSQRLVSLLSNSGFRIEANAGLFVLASCLDAAGVHRQLAQAGVWTRIFDYAPTWIRFGLPPRDAWKRFEAAVSLLDVVASEAKADAGVA